MILDKCFNGYTVQTSGNFNDLNGQKIIQTITCISHSSPSIYEVKLENGKICQLYEDEMILL